MGVNDLSDMANLKGHLLEIRNLGNFEKRAGKFPCSLKNMGIFF
jgi:hypothetical protein